jgi:hypothetical protein
MTAANDAVLAEMVGYYPLDAFGDNTVLDHSLYGHHLRKKAAAQLHPQGGLDLDTPGDPIEDAPTVYSIFRKQQEFVIAFDVYTQSSGTIISVDSPGSTDRMWRIVASSTNTQVQAIVSFDGSTTTVVTSTATTSIRDRWVRVVLAYDGANVMVYNDGEFAAAARTGDLNLPDNDVRLEFGGYDGGSGSITGAIKNLMIYDGVLTSGQRAFIAKRGADAGNTWLPPKQTVGEIPVYLFGGQSNAVGGAAGTPSGLGADTWTRRDVNVYASQTDQAQFFGADLARRSTTGAGVEYGMALAVPTGAAIIGHGANGTDLHTDWDATGGTQFETWKTTVTTGLNDLRALGYTPIIKGIVWDQGTADTGTQANAEAYKRNLIDLIDAMRSHVGNEDCVFCIVHLDDEAYVGYPYLETVRTAQAEVANERNVTLVSQANLAKVDHVHRDWGSQLHVGRQCVKAIDGASTLLTGATVSNIERKLGVRRASWPKDF